MRMWLANPKIMCRQHLLGEHAECHAFVGSINKGIRLDGYIRNNLLEIKSLIERHRQLSDEMMHRGMKHLSTLPEPQIQNLSNDIINYKIDADRSLKDLLGRCNECNKRNQNIYKLLK